MSRCIDLTGQTFDLWTVIGRAKNASDGKSQWKCCCECGTVRIVRGEHLRSGASKCCGCRGRNNLIARNTKHGKAHSRLYNIWCGMKDRCYRPNDEKYPQYGGRGITVCEEWRNNYVVFEAWALTHGYKSTLTIDRINVNGNYEPSNCRWITIQAQAFNKTNSHLIEYKGEIKTVAEWAALYGIKYNTLISRLKRGMDIGEALKFKINNKHFAN